MITGEAFARFAGKAEGQSKPKASRPAFDVDGYIAKHGFKVTRRKPWQSHPGGTVLELGSCPLNPDHTDGSAAFTLVHGVPGFHCHHNGCYSKTIKNVFARYPPDSLLNGPTETGENSPRAAQSQTLIECAADAELFHTSDLEAFACVPVNDHREVWPLKSSGFRHWLTRAFYQRLGKAPGAQAKQDALDLLEARAQYDSPEHQVFTRFAPYGESIYVDLCNEKWEAVEITSKDWRIVQTTPVRFRRLKGMLPLPYPVRGGSLSHLRRLINCGDDRNWILTQAWLIAACRPQGPCPILILGGEQGSAKSTTARLLRGLIDPASAPIRTPPRDERDLVIAAHNSWAVAYDNMSGVPPWLSDALCRVATGGGFSTRQLYTDCEEVIFNVMRPLILNGIDHLAERPDLADRAIVLNLPRIEEEARQDEAQLYATYEQERPLILGALLTAISAALAHLPEVRLLRKPRMADFALWASAAETALGWQPGAFMDAYSGNHSQAVQETLETDPVGAAMLARFGDQTHGYEWSGSNKDLLKLLEQEVDARVQKSRAWPKTPRKLSSPTSETRHLHE